MFLFAWRLLTLMLVALSMSVAMAHLLELPAKMTFDGALWLTLLQQLYPPGFGTAGSTAEVGAVISAVALAFLLRHRRLAFGWTLAAALCVLAAHAAFWIWVAPVNAALLPLTPQTLPADWERLRSQWEYTHALRAVLQGLALAALVVSILRELAAERRA